MTARYSLVSRPRTAAGWWTIFVALLLAVFGLLTPLAGAIAQEVIDVLAILNSARVVMAPRKLSDFDALSVRPTAAQATGGK